MPHIVINACNLRPGGGVQVTSALLSRFSDKNTFTVLWTDPSAKSLFERIIGPRPNITYLKPTASDSTIHVFLWLIMKLPALLNELKADLILSINHFFPSGVVPQVVYHLNVLRFDRPKTSIFKASEIADLIRDNRAATALRKADANIFESNYLKEIAEKKSAIRNGQVIYIGIDETLTESHQIASDSDSSSIIVLTSPHPHKDNSRLIYMLKELIQRVPERPWKLKIASGRTPDSFSEFTDLAKSEGIWDRIEWLGFKTHDELEAIAHDSLCLVSTSQVESFCMVALEAMAWGCPAIVGNTTSMPESVGDAALIAQAGNAQSFSDQIMLLCNTPNLREQLINKGYKHIKYMSWRSAANQFENVFEQVITVKK